MFDESALEEGVEKILISEYGVEADQIQAVDCPARQEVKLGNKFTCTVTLGSQNDPEEKAVDITVREEDTGQYEASRPRTR